MNKERLIPYRKFCIKHKYSYCIPEDYKFVWDLTDKEGEEELQRLKDSLPSKRQTEYNQRDINKRKYKNENQRTRNDR